MPKRVRLRETSAPYQELIGWRYSEADNGSCDSALEVRDDLMNSRQALRSVHGGAIYSLADGAMGGALYSALNKDEWATTVGMNITYFRAVTSGSLSCTARIIHRGDKLTTLEAEVRSDGHLIAKATGTWFIFKVTGLAKQAEV
jgi:acyl-CoA thioesterase